MRWKKADKEKPTGPLWKRILRSLGRIIVLLFLTLFFCGGGFYLWNPQKLHYPRKKPPADYPKVDPDSAKLFTKGTQVTVVAGHPDDTEFFISGALMKLHDAGVKITVIVVTDGDKSYYPPFTTNVDENRKVRRQEQIDASARYGANVIFLGGPDGRYDPDEPVLRKKLEDAMVATKPDYVVTFDSEYLPTVQHRDHENSGRAGLELAPKTSAKWVLLFASMAKNYYVDTSKYWTQRTELVAIHKSQFYGAKLPMIIGMLMEREIDDGQAAGVEMAEGFRAIKLRD